MLCYVLNLCNTKRLTAFLLESSLIPNSLFFNNSRYGKNRDREAHEALLMKGHVFADPCVDKQEVMSQRSALKGNW